MRETQMITARPHRIAVLALLGVVAVGCGTRSPQDVTPLATTTSVVEEVAPPSTLPENLEPKGSPANFVVVVGNYGLPARIDSLDPLVLDTLNQTSPTDLVIASNGAGDPTKRRPGAPPTASGAKVTFTYQLFNWQTTEYYDGTPAGELVEATVDANDLPATLNEALHWAVTEGRVIAVIPPGSPEIPGFAPPDSAYYYVVDVFAVT